jgi:hypothetical protein
MISSSSTSKSSTSEKKNKKRISISVKAARSSLRRSIKFVNKQSKFHLAVRQTKIIFKTLT